MLVRIESSGSSSRASTAAAPGVQLLEVVSPRTNAASYTPLEHLFAALARSGGVSLEIAGDAHARRFYARVAGNAARERLEAPLGAVYPQARVRTAAADPACQLPGEQIASCALELQEPEYRRFASRGTTKSSLTAHHRRIRCWACWRPWAVSRQGGVRWRS